MKSKEQDNTENVPVKRTLVTTAYSMLLAFLPVLSIYYSGIPGTNVADICLMVVWLVTIVFVMFGQIDVQLLWKSFSSPHRLLLAFCFYCVALVLVGFIKEDSQLFDIIVRTSRIAFYLCSVVVLSTLYVDFETMRKGILIVSLLGSLYLIYQVIVYRTTGNVAKGFVSFLPLYSQEYASLDYNSFYAYEFQRPTSFFLEPAHFSRYAIFGLTLSLFGRRNGVTKLPYLAAAIFITISIVLSTSGIGIVYSSVIWVFCVARYILCRVKEGKLRLVAISIAILVTLLASLYVLSPTLQFVINRTTNLRPGSAFSARLGSMQELIRFDSIIELIFGHGYGAVPAVGTWMSGLTYVLYGTGVMGFGVLFVSLFIMFLNSKINLTRRIMVILVALLMIVDDSFNSVVVVLLYTLVMRNYEQTVGPMVGLAQCESFL